jgi:hypothetical protein
MIFSNNKLKHSQKKLFHYSQNQKNKEIFETIILNS